MRIKAVLRDTDILQLEAGSKSRIVASAKKNTDRFVSWSSLLKVMGLSIDERTTMLNMLKDSGLHIWLTNEGDQDLIFISEADTGPPDGLAYRWQ